MTTNSPSTQSGHPLERLQALVKRIYGLEGCLWAQEQTHYTMRRYVLEEANEVLQVLNEMGAVPVPDAFTEETVAPSLARHLCDELGDLLFQVLAHAALAESEGLFTLNEVLEGLRAKLERRHPHVFGERTATTLAEVERIWRDVKAQERQQTNVDHETL